MSIIGKIMSIAGEIMSIVGKIMSIAGEIMSIAVRGRTIATFLELKIYSSKRIVLSSIVKKFIY